MKIVLVSFVSFVASTSAFAEPGITNDELLRMSLQLKEKVSRLERSAFVPVGLVKAGSRTGYKVATECSAIEEKGWEYSGAYEIQIVKTLSCGSKTFYLVRQRGNALNPQPLDFVDSQYVSLY